MRDSETREDRRAGLLAALVVGGLGVVACGLYLWLLSFEPAVGATLGRPPAAYAGWVALTGIQGVLLRWHRRAPIRVLLGVFGLFLIATGLVGEAGSGSLSLPLWFAVFGTVAYARLTIALPLVSAAWLVHVTWQSVLYQLLGVSALTLQLLLLLAVQQGMFYAACVAVGFAVRGYRERSEAAADRARLASETAEARAQAAVAAERNRMARELHDLAAHQLVDVVLTARTAKLNPGTSATALDEIVGAGTAALNTLRSAVTALRIDESEPDADQPLAARIDRVLATARTTRGLVVTPSVDMSGLEDLNPAIRGTLERVLSEALANSHTHAPGAPVTVRVDRTENVVRLDVTNPAPELDHREAKGTGVGLIGATERAELLGGSLTAGADQAGNWRLALRLPVSVGDEGSAP